LKGRGEDEKREEKAKTGSVEEECRIPAENNSPLVTILT
jgi:hypothetical protein